MFKIQIIILLLTFVNNFSQDLSFGISAKLVGGESIEPFYENSNFIYKKSDWNILQYGVGLNLTLYKYNNFIFEYSNLITYGQKKEAVKIQTIIAHNYDYIIKTDINHFFSLNNSVIIYYNLTKYLDIGIGFNTIFRSYKYSDKYLSGTYKLDLGNKNFNLFNVGPTLKLSFVLTKNIRFQVGSNYYNNSEEYKVARIKHDPDLGGSDIFGIKKINNYEYFIAIYYRIL